VASEPPPPTEQPAATPPPQSPAPAPVQQPASPEPAATQDKPKPKTAARRRPAHPVRHRGVGDVAAAQAGSLVAVKALLPDGPTADESSPHLVLIAAGALLALVLASGSMLSVAARAVKGQLR
jgi:outer membrane biosynthesis protein TonB